MQQFRKVYVQQVLGGVLLATLLNFSLNTINDFSCLSTLLPAQEIESFTELLLEEMLDLPGTIQDTPENDQESSIAAGLAFIVYKTVEIVTPFLVDKTRLNHILFASFYLSRFPEKESPPPQLA
jgi:hypothetical protein